MLADSSGRIGWTVNGLPRRVGFDGSRPVSWADGSRRGRRSSGPRCSAAATARCTRRTTARYRSSARAPEPRVDDAVARHASPSCSRQSDVHGARLLAMQLDTRTKVYDQIRAGCRGRCERRRRPAARTRARTCSRGTAARTLISPGSGRSSTMALLERAQPLFAPAVAADPGFVYRWPLADEPLRGCSTSAPRTSDE